MRKIAVLALVTLPLAAGCPRGGGSESDVPAPAGVEAAERTITPEGILADIRVLSADDMEGRGPGTPGDRKARAYIAKRLEAMGYRPAGPGGGWEQTVPMVRVQAVNPGPWSFRAGDRREDLAWWKDCIYACGSQSPEVKIENAGIVFVGYGIQAPEEKWDDFKGADVRGKVLLMMNDDPDWDPALFGGKRRTYYGRWTYKYESAARQGALGAIIIHTDPSAGYGWNVVQTSWSGPQFELTRTGEPTVQVKGWVTEDAARRLAKLAGQDLDALIGAARSREFRPVPLGVTTSLTFRSEVGKSESANVLGILPGSDPELSKQAVVYSAHHDHLGVGEPDATGDRIYNGALDNASGVSQILAAAGAFAALPERPKRSVLIAAVAAEEQGLLGSEYYCAHPTIAPSRLVAEINVDGGNVFGRTKDVAIVGRGKSDLEDWLAAAAEKQGRYIVDEPDPDKGYYYRSDQLNFAKIGVPALYFRSGYGYVGRPADWGRERNDEYRRLHYHQPSDQVDPSWDLSGMAEDVRLAFEVGLRAASGGPMPKWRPGIEFKR